MFSFLKPYLTSIALGLILGAIIYIGFLHWRVHNLEDDKQALETENAQLEADKFFAEKQIQALAGRETKSKGIDKSYERERQNLQNKENGPVSPVLRYAVDTDLLRE